MTQSPGLLHTPGGTTQRYQTRDISFWVQSLCVAYGCHMQVCLTGKA